MTQKCVERHQTSLVNRGGQSKSQGVIIMQPREQLELKSVGENVGGWNFHRFLVGVYIGTITFENCLIVIS